jgi:hypothetical protein
MNPPRIVKKPPPIRPPQGKPKPTLGANTAKPSIGVKG